MMNGQINGQVVERAQVVRNPFLLQNMVES
jgi:hypothetical protein